MFDGQMRIPLFFTLLVFITINTLLAQEPGTVFNENGLKIEKSQYYYLDDNNEFDINDIVNKKNIFFSIIDGHSNFGIVQGSLWYKIDIVNNDKNTKFFLEIPSALVNSVHFYKTVNGKVVDEALLGLDYPYSTRKIKYKRPQFTFDLVQGQKTTIFLQLKSDFAVIYPIIIDEFSELDDRNNSLDLWIVVYISFMLSMLIYNLFLYISVKDISYLYYVLYALFTMSAHLSIEGVFLAYFGEIPAVNVKSVIVLSSLSGFFFVFFADNFLNLKVYASKIRKGYLGLLWIYVAALVFVALGFVKFSTQLLDLGGAYGAILTLVIAILVYRRGFKPAGIFLVSWIVFLIGIIVFILRNQGILEFNDFTNHTLQLGTVIEVMLLSFALAARINLLKKEKENIQKKQLDTLAENQRIIANQNVILEKEVEKRTEELQNTNVELNKTMEFLQSAQLQLIEQEKMASLGQLTAGIAHEINNPINFVLSNIKPLSQDVNDLMELLNKYQEITKKEISDNEEYKEILEFEEDLDIEYTSDEIGQLLEGIEEGANRTRYVVKGLRTFSRLDESNFMAVDLLEGLDSTLSLLANQTKNEINIIKNYEQIPDVECNGSKLNQVFMNLLTNSIQALKENPEKRDDLEINITVSKIDDENVQFSFKDNGPGISEENQKKIFDPFFTTKDVGKGTGLGLSIVFKVIKNHNGTILLNSEIGKGAEFLITLPIFNKSIVVDD